MRSQLNIETSVISWPGANCSELILDSLTVSDFSAVSADTSRMPSEVVASRDIRETQLLKFSEDSILPSHPNSLIASPCIVIAVPCDMP